jgi:hypothetical protein
MAVVAAAAAAANSQVFMAVLAGAVAVDHPGPRLQQKTSGRGPVGLGRPATVSSCSVGSKVALALLELRTYDQRGVTVLSRPIPFAHPQVKVRTMKRITILLALSLTAGCGGQNATTRAVPQGAMVAQTAHRGTSGSSGDLLYIIGGGPSNQKITILTYPQYQPFDTIKIGGPWAVCSDRSGNVWATTYDGYAYEYAHGGTKPIAKLYTGSYDVASGCGVDPTTGNLAVVSTAGFIIVFTNARGSGTDYGAPFTAFRCSYDNRGNLFVDGLDRFQIGELPKGASEFKTITLDKTGQLGAGGIQWDGHYMAISTRLPHHQHVIFRFYVSGSQGRVVQTIHFKDQWQAWTFWIQGRNMIAPTPHDGLVGVWPYPRGGKRTATLNVCCDSGMTVSVAPHVSRIRK